MRQPPFIVGLTVGTIAAIIALDPQYISGTGGSWIRPEGDLNVYVAAWYYYIADAWRLPLFEVPAMSYPEGSNVVFSDALPVALLFSKIIHTFLGVAIVPFGWWALLTYMLQGGMAARLVHACGGRSPWAWVTAAVLAICNIPFLWRIGHPAVSSHFLILWALALYFESTAQQRLKGVELTALLCLVLMVNPYLFAIVAPLVAATVLTLWREHHLRWSDARTLAAGFLIVSALGIGQGYDLLLRQPRAMVAEGFGKFSWNMVTIFVPPEQLWGFPRGIVRDATGGQYEGESYVGLGSLVLLVVACVVARAALIALIRRHIVLVITLVALALAAASNRVYAANTLLFSYGLPASIEGIASTFRISARFIWPSLYMLMVAPVALLFSHQRLARAIPVVALAIGLQVNQAISTIQTVRVITSNPLPDLIDTPRLTGWLRTHERVWQFPSWWCGGLSPSRVWLGTEANRELQVQVLAARLNKASNSVISARSFKDCASELEWSRAPQFADGVLYLFGPEYVSESPRLAEFASTSHCVNLGWAYACSTAW